MNAMPGKSSVKKSKNPMLRPRIEKVTVNVCVGKSGEPLEKAVKILQQITGQTPRRILAKKTVKGFGIQRGEPIACMVTLRREKAREFLGRAFKAIGNVISESRFDQFGNFSFGIKEHIDIPGTKYYPELGVVGMDVCATISRPGSRVKERRRARRKIGSRHRLTKEESIQFIRESFGVKIAREGHAKKEV